MTSSKTTQGHANLNCFSEDIGHNTSITSTSTSIACNNSNPTIYWYSYYGTNKFQLYNYLKYLKKQFKFENVHPVQFHDFICRKANEKIQQILHKFVINFEFAGSLDWEVFDDIVDNLGVSEEDLIVEQLKCLNDTSGLESPKVSIEVKLTCSSKMLDSFALFNSTNFVSNKCWRRIYGILKEEYPCLMRDAAKQHPEFFMFLVDKSKSHTLGIWMNVRDYIMGNMHNEVIERYFIAAK